MNYVKEEFPRCLNKVTRPFKTTKGMKLPVWYPPGTILPWSSLARTGEEARKGSVDTLEDLAGKEIGKTDGQSLTDDYLAIWYKALLM
ncbi:hypothetical protein Acr_00g0025940 [Actinidia rufa]|uniref:Uncharacterized protein n=1 Tax=Actinidia rufa TaxID=165716 RepID=A0A7J0DDL9_9ERIC|nr:hypothetical protein Acr_00g0025940 [Actinidia rufa]